MKKVMLCLVMCCVALAVIYGLYDDSITPDNIKVSDIETREIETIYNGEVVKSIIDNATGQNIDWSGVAETEPIADMEKFKESCDSFHQAYQTVRNAQFGIVDTEIDDATMPIDINPWVTEPTDFTFGYNDTEIVFEWNEETCMFNVVYDKDNCTEAAETFFVCMMPYFNEHIKAKAKLLNEQAMMVLCITEFRDDGTIAEIDNLKLNDPMCLITVDDFLIELLRYRNEKGKVKEQ